MEKTPEELKQEAEAKAAEDARSAKSLEDEMSLTPGKTPEVETVESLKAQLTKKAEEAENYKTGMLKYKGIAKNAGHKDESDEDDEDDASASLDVKKVATDAAVEVVENQNEKAAIKAFTDKYPALKDPTKWREVILHYKAISGKGSSDNIQRDLEAALNTAKYYGGGKIAGEDIRMTEYAAVSQEGSTAPRERVTELQDSTLEMGANFGHSAESLGKEDNSLYAEISIV